MYTTEEKETINRAMRIIEKNLKQEYVELRNSGSVADYLTLYFSQHEREGFVMLSLDVQFRLISVVELFSGTLDKAAVYPREVVKTALQENAAHVIIAHNHVSGTANPSPDDEAITQRLKVALRTVDINLLDHYVIGAAEVVSFAECGLL